MKTLKTQIVKIVQVTCSRYNGNEENTFEKDKLYSACQARKQVGNTRPKKSMMSTSKAKSAIKP